MNKKIVQQRETEDLMKKVAAMRAGGKDFKGRDRVEQKYHLYGD